MANGEPALCPRCELRAAEPEHDCPYDAEVNNDLPARRRCTCCDHCALNECQDGI